MIAKINANDLTLIVMAGYEYIKKCVAETDENNAFLQRAKELRKKLFSITWDENTELFIDEMPF